MKYLLSLCVFVPFVTFAQITDEREVHYWEAVILHAPMISVAPDNEAGEFFYNGSASLQIGKHISPSLSVGVSPGMQWLDSDSRRFDLNLYAKFTRPLNPWLKWFVFVENGPRFSRYRTHLYDDCNTPIGTTLENRWSWNTNVGAGFEVQINSRLSGVVQFSPQQSSFGLKWRF